MRPLAVVALIAALLGCAEPTPAPPLPPSAPAAPLSPAPRVLTRADYLATFVDDRLVRCAGFVRTWTIPASMPEWKPQDLDVDALAAGFTGSTVRVNEACAVSFADRAELASCVLRIGRPSDDGPSGSITISESYYGFVDGPDPIMQGCLDGGGEWTALRRDSRAYRRAEIERMEGEVTRALRHRRGRPRSSLR